MAGKLQVAALALFGVVAACAKDSPPPPGATDPGAQAAKTLPAWGTAPPVATEPAYLDAELRRAAGDAGLAEATGFADQRRIQALWSLARIGGEPAMHRLAAVLDGPREGGGPYASLGLLDAPGAGEEEKLEAWQELEDALWRRYAIETDAGSELALLFDIARIGGEASIERLAVELADLPGPDADEVEVERHASATTALGILCARGFALDESSRDAIAQGISTSRPELRRAAIYALGRCARASTELFALAEERKVLADRLEARLEGAPDEQRRLTWIAFGALGVSPESLVPALFTAPDVPWWVEVEAVRALAQSPEGRKLLLERLSDAPLAQWTGARVHVLLEALAAMRSHVATDAAAEAWLRELEGELDSELAEAPERRVRELALLRCEVATLSAIRRGNLDALRVCRSLGLALDPTPRLEVEALLAMTDAVLDKSARLDALLARASDSDAHVAAPALAALAEVDDDAANPVLRSALEREDLGVVAAAAGAVAARSRDAGKRSLDVVPALRRVVNRMNNAEGIEARLSAIEALGVLARRPERGVKPGSEGEPLTDEAPWLESVVLPLARDPAAAVRDQARRALAGRPELLERFDRPVPVAGRDAFASDMETQLAALRDAPAAGLRVATEAGDFVIELGGARAPLNHANMVALARRGYFEGLRFHRVAAGFVVQGGDPRGDGYGGPGHLVPCEWSNHRYERGTVGMALAGKDTGGSQFFITQARQPHLDGRYTVIGRVVEGMDVVDRILPGDAITRIEVLDTMPGDADAP